MVSLDLLQQFCRQHEGRYDFEKPFVQRGYRYATDGVVMIRVPATGEIDTQTELPFDLNAKFFTRPKFATAEFIPFPAVEVKYTKTACEACFGNGKHSCGCEYCKDYECRDCGGVGFSEKYEPDLVSIGFDQYISGKHLMLIRMLPNPKFAKQIQERNQVTFIFDGGQGVLMMRIDRPNEKSKTDTSGT